MSKQSNKLQLIRCFTDTQTYCLDTFWVKAVENTDEMLVNKNNQTPLGWITYEQEKVPVFSLALQLKQPLTTEISQSKIIIFNSKPLWAILVDKVSRVFEVEKENKLSLPSIVENSSVSAFQGIIRVNSEMLLYLAPQYLHPKSLSKEIIANQKELNWSDLLNQESKGHYKGQILTFSITNQKDNLALGLSVTQVLQVLKSATIIPIPISPKHILGFINWQNIPVTVVDLNLYLGLESNLINEPDTRFLIVRAAVSEALIAILIHPMVKTLNLPIENKPINLPFSTNKPFSISCFRIKDETLVILDIDSIIGLNATLSAR